MIPDRIEPLDKRRSKVFIDGDFAFVLYNGELKHYGIEEGRPLEEAKLRELAALLGRRARERALSLLKVRDRTEWEMRQKLAGGFYPAAAVEETIAFLKEYGYLDDGRYARNYVEICGKRKSRAELIQGLRRKGIDRHMAEELCRECEPDTEEALAALLRKRRFDAGTASSDEKRRTAAYLMRRGFSWEEIRKALGGF